MREIASSRPACIKSVSVVDNRKPEQRPLRLLFPSSENRNCLNNGQLPRVRRLHQGNWFLMNWKLLSVVAALAVPALLCAQLATKHGGATAQETAQPRSSQSQQDARGRSDGPVGEAPIRFSYQPIDFRLDSNETP